jgi:hypothetical protein
MGTLEGFCSALGSCPPASPPLDSLGLAKPSRALALASKARLRQRVCLARTETDLVRLMNSAG